MLRVVACVLALLAAGAMPALGDPTPVLFVGMQHFKSRANVYNVSVGNVLTPKRQAEIEAISRGLARFAPTIVVLERTHGTSMLSEHYHEYLRGNFALPADEPYQIGFRVARLAHVSDVYDIDYFNDFPFQSVVDFAGAHGQSALLKATDAIYLQAIARERMLLAHGTLLDVLRFINEPAVVRAGGSAYMYLDRVGDATHPVGTTLVTDWYARNLQLFANLTRLIHAPGQRVLMLYGQGHEYLMQQFIGASPDLRVVDPQTFLRP